MQLPENPFMRAIAAGRQQIGLWCSLPGPYVAETVTGSGFDWLLFDTEHSPGDPLTVLAQFLKAAEIVRAPSPSAALELFYSDHLDAAAGVRQALDAFRDKARSARPPRYLHGHPADGRLTAQARGAYLQSLVDDLKSSGWVRAALDRNCQQAVAVAP